MKLLTVTAAAALLAMGCTWLAALDAETPTLCGGRCPAPMHCHSGSCEPAAFGAGIRDAGPE